MSHSPFTESVVEEEALDYFSEIGYTVASGPDLAPNQPLSKRDSYAQVPMQNQVAPFEIQT